MIGSESFLDKDPEDLEQYLVQLARQDVAPAAARQRALLNVASAAVGVGLLSGAAAYGSRTSLIKATSWLVAKWLAAGLGAGLLTVTVAQGVAQWAAAPPQAEPTATAALIKQKSAVRVAPRLTTAEAPAITPESDSSAAPPSVAFGALPSPATPRGPSISTPASSAAPGLTPAPAAPPAASSLTAELSFLEQARRALLQHAPTQALRTLDEYRLAFPSGSLQVEAAALRVEAVGQSGNRALAQRLAESFLTSFPTSPLAGRVRAAAESFRSGTQKP